MADRKAVNKYYPPDFDPRRHKTLNRYRHNRLHPQKHGLPVVRFELPFSVWCGKCDEFIKKATRFNSTKRVVGKYLSMPILEFECYCRRCKNKFYIRTDPENRTYVVDRGGKAKAAHGSGSAADDPDVAALLFDEDSIVKRRADPMANLEHTVIDREVSQAELPRLARLKRRRDGCWKDDYEVGKRMRRKFRKMKEEECIEEAKRRSVLLGEEEAEKVPESDGRRVDYEAREDMSWMQRHEERQEQEKVISRLVKKAHDTHRRSRPRRTVGVQDDVRLRHRIRTSRIFRKDPSSLSSSVNSSSSRTGSRKAKRRKTLPKDLRRQLRQLKQLKRTEKRKKQRRRKRKKEEKERKRKLQGSGGSSQQHIDQREHEHERDVLPAVPPPPPAAAAPAAATAASSSSYAPPEDSDVVVSSALSLIGVLYGDADG